MGRVLIIIYGKRALLPASLTSFAIIWAQQPRSPMRQAACWNRSVTILLAIVRAVTVHVTASRAANAILIRSKSITAPASTIRRWGDSLGKIQLDWLGGL